MRVEDEVREDGEGGGSPQVSGVDVMRVSGRLFSRFEGAE